MKITEILKTKFKIKFYNVLCVYISIYYHKRALIIISTHPNSLTFSFYQTDILVVHKNIKTQNIDPDKSLLLYNGDESKSMAVTLFSSAKSSTKTIAAGEQYTLKGFNSFYVSFVAPNEMANNNIVVSSSHIT